MFGLDLPVIWFVLIAVLFAGYFLLEGFDFGVGILASIVGRTRAEKQTIVGTIGPVWDGNEVWLITAGGALFAAFPEWYATMFSGLYFPLFLILVALIVRVVALEWRKKITDPTWEKWCNAGLAFGSWGPAILWDLIVANLVRGLPIRADLSLNAGEAFVSIFNPYALLGAAAFTLLCIFHGLAFIRLKTTGVVRDRAAAFIVPVAALTALCGVAFLVWTVAGYSQAGWAWSVAALIAVCLILASVAMMASHDGWAFLLSCVAVVGLVVLVFGTIFPEVMPTTLADGQALTVWNAASGAYTLRFMTWVALIMCPLVIAYQAWTYWVFSKRLRADDAHVEADDDQGALTQQPRSSQPNGTSTAEKAGL
ncbi:cytochrome d ubiquinol oxidase subunit II [Corynebacterium atypicum]|uniref:cytochrome d ubiquinol oxidase subunit II n=1 Tax=Corynebacterium atypicum TaxID=191610 RepID=UPI00068FBB0A|nr:cytochrome d ubiquinol oxidase subunit II [Corynebacterium atypicum]